MADEGETPRFRSPRDAVLLARALPLAGRAQRVRAEPLRRVVDRMASCGRWTDDPRRALTAAARATSRYVRWFGGIDSCLTRSLVAGALLSARREVVLRVGFRPGSAEDPVDGHAWLTVDGDPVEVASPLGDRVAYTSVLEIPFRAEDAS